MMYTCCIYNYSVMHWSSLLRRGKEVLNVAGPTVPTLKHPGSSAQPLGRVQISTMAVKDNLMVVGGCQGELICKNLERPGVAFCTKFTNQENNITNAVVIYQSSNGLTRLMTANNDAIGRVFDTEYFARLNCFPFSWSVREFDGKLIAVLGDSMDCLVADAQSGKISLDHSINCMAPAWQNSSNWTTCRLWDLRNLSQSLDVLKGRMGSLRAIKFTSDGQFMAMAEPAGFVHIYDTKSGYMQEIVLFGEIAGISFSPDPGSVRVADRTYGSVLEFNRRHYSRYLDTFI